MFEATPPREGVAPQWKFEYWFLGQPSEGRQLAPIVEETENSLTFEVPVVQATPPGIRARLRVRTSYWNDWQ